MGKGRPMRTEAVGRSPKQIETRWSPNQPPGFIVPEALYTIEEVKARLRMGDAVWRQFRRKGAKTIRLGRRDYILGSAVIDVFVKIAQEKEQAGRAGG
jgi:hypothetical protein